MLIDIIDNTNTGGIDSQTSVKGQENSYRLVIPNQGITKSGVTVHFFSHGLVKIKNQYFVHPEQIFLRNGYLQKPGVIVSKNVIRAQDEIFDYEDECFFRVLDSNIEIEKGDLVLVNARTSYRFNYNGREYFYIDPSQIFATYSHSRLSFEAGPEYMMLEKEDQDDDLILGLDNKKLNSGLKNGFRYFFSDVEYEIDYDAKEFLIVSKQDIKLFERV